MSRTISVPTSDGVAKIANISETLRPSGSHGTVGLQLMYSGDLNVTVRSISISILQLMYSGDFHL